jgi:hypothetical protein
MRFCLNAINDPPHPEERRGAAEARLEGRCGNAAERFTRPFAGTTIYFDIEVSEAAQGRCPRPAIMRGSPEQ